TAANVTSFDLGINGIMVDLASTSGTLGTGDFTFQVSTDGSTWSTAPTPSISQSAIGDNTRVKIIWSDYDIQNEWLNVTVKSAANGGTHPGLATDDVFYFGNLTGDSDGVVGESGFSVDINDYNKLLTEYTSSGVSITDRFDFNRDGNVDGTDS